MNYFSLKWSKCIYMPIWCSDFGLNIYFHRFGIVIKSKQLSSEVEKRKNDKRKRLFTGDILQYIEYFTSQVFLLLFLNILVYCFNRVSINMSKALKNVKIQDHVKLIVNKLSLLIWSEQPLNTSEVASFSAKVTVFD